MNFETKNIHNMKGNILLIDTETARGLEDPIPYDVSILITDSKGKAIFKQCFLISEIWNNLDLYNKSFYGISKRGLYNEMLDKGKAKVILAKDFNKELKQLIKNNNVKMIGAYNIAFDLKAYNNLCLDYGLKSHFKDIDYIDIQLLAQERLRMNKKYYKFISDNNLITPKGYASCKVDTVYKYLFKSNKNELHVGIEDLKQESKILQKFLSINNYAIINQVQTFIYFLKDMKIN